VLGASSCAGPPPPPSGAPPLPFVVSSALAAPEPPVTSAPATPSASAKAAAAPRVLGCEPRGAVEVPKLFRTLFEKGRRMVYATRDEVDPHDQDGHLVVTRVKVECVVGALRRFKSVVGSEIDCKTSAKESVLPADGLAFLANDRALWMPSLLPSDEAGVEEILKEPPLFSATPANERRTREEPGMFEGQVGTCDNAVEVGAARVCSDESCRGVHPYGPTEDRRCFSEARGFETWRQVNLQGPRVTTWDFVSAKPGPSLPAAVAATGTVPLCVD
jgi:hypothetical protein